MLPALPLMQPMHQGNSVLRTFANESAQRYNPVSLTALRQLLPAAKAWVFPEDTQMSKTLA